MALQDLGSSPLTSQSTEPGLRDGLTATKVNRTAVLASKYCQGQHPENGRYNNSRYCRQVTCKGRIPPPALRKRVPKLESEWTASPRPKPSALATRPHCFSSKLGLLPSEHAEKEIKPVVMLVRVHACTPTPGS